MNVKRLQAQMKLYGDTQETLAQAMGLSRSRLNAKIRGYKGAEFRQTEINFISHRYGLSSSDLEAIFFEQKVS